MKNLRTIMVSCALVGLAACGESDSPVAPAGPQYDGGGYTIGSGSREAGAGTTSSDASPERGGGFTIGSGG